MANWQTPDAKWEAKLTLQSILNPEDDRQEDWQLCVNARQAVSKTRHAFILHSISLVQMSKARINPPVSLQG